jgi:hypothetical protein
MQLCGDRFARPACGDQFERKPAPQIPNPLARGFLKVRFEEAFQLPQ